MLRKKNKRAEDSLVRKHKMMKLLGSFLIAAILFGVLLGAERTMLDDYAKEEVVLCRKDILKGTKITEKNVDQYFYVHEVDALLVDENCIRSLRELIDSTVGRELSTREIVRKGDCAKEAEIYAKFKEPVIGSVSSESIGNIVGGTLRRGDYVNIAVINKDTLNYELVMEHVYVLDAFTNAGKKVSAETEDVPATMLIIVEEKEKLNQFYTALKLGTVVVTKTEQQRY